MKKMIAGSIVVLLDTSQQEGKLVNIPYLKSIVNTIIKLVSPSKSTLTLSVLNMNNTQLPAASNLNTTALLSQQTHVMTQVFRDVVMKTLKSESTPIIAN